jgi:tRNA modification GTPase
MTLVDTAGIRVSAADAVEAEGISRAHSAAAAADLLLIVVDGSQPLNAEDRAVLNDTAARSRLVVRAKSDLPRTWNASDLGSASIDVAAPANKGVDALRAAMVAALTSDRPAGDAPAVTNLRHVALLEQAREALLRGASAARGSAPEEFVAADVAEARRCLEEITGRRTADDTLNAIFSRFCIGK